MTNKTPLHPAVSDPSFCFIAPINYLTLIPEESTTHLVLAHLVDENEQYASFYRHRRLKGDYIMMDNSAYELKEPYSPDKLLELAEKCGAHAIVLPDYPFQPSAVTIDAADKFIPQFKAEGYHTFFVPQSKKGDLEDWITGYQYASSNPDIDIIGMSILGIPNALPHIDPTYGRVVMTQILQDRNLFNNEKHHHYLGLNSGPKLEIPTLLRMGSFQTVSKIKLPVDFHLSATKDEATRRRISHNIQLTQLLFNPYYYNMSDVWYAEE